MIMSALKTSPGPRLSQVTRTTVKAYVYIDYTGVEV